MDMFKKSFEPHGVEASQYIPPSAPLQPSVHLSRQLLSPFNASLASAPLQPSMHRLNSRQVCQTFSFVHLLHFFLLTCSAAPATLTLTPLACSFPPMCTGLRTVSHRLIHNLVHLSPAVSSLRRDPSLTTSLTQVCKTDGNCRMVASGEGRQIDFCWETIERCCLSAQGVRGRRYCCCR